MRYQLGVEDIEPDHWVAWVFELPGCFASAHTQAEAVATAPARIAAYFRWLATYGHSMPGVDAPIQTEVVTVFQAFPSESNYLVNAFFEADRPPLTQQEVDQALWLLDCSRQDLLAVLGPVSSERLTRPIAGEVQGILQHIAQGERWYLQNIGLEQSALLENPWHALDQTRTQTRAWLPALVGDTRILEWKRERWSVRKVLRRTRLTRTRSHPADQEAAGQVSSPCLSKCFSSHAAHAKASSGLASAARLLLQHRTNWRYHQRVK
jgi:predicted RNase H-like HicB family nuclease